jgi:hypothetical protein
MIAVLGRRTNCSQYDPSRRAFGVGVRRTVRHGRDARTAERSTCVPRPFNGQWGAGDRNSDGSLAILSEENDTAAHQIVTLAFL